MKQIKLLFVYLFSIGIAAVTLSNRHVAIKVHAFSEGPPAGVTGAPGEGNCTECHAGSGINSGQGSIKVSGPTNYTPGQTYTITIQDTSSDQSRRRWGFEATVLKKGGQPVGQLAVINGNLTQMLSDGGPFPNRQYIEHTEQGTFAGQTGGATWTFSWTAPADDEGTATIYVASNFANDDGNDTGDQIHTANLAIPSMSSGATPEPPPVILNAAVSDKTLTLMGQNFDSSSVVSVNGKVVQTEFDSSSPTILTCPKGGKSIKVGNQVTLRVKNADTGEKSAKFKFSRSS